MSLIDDFYDFNGLPFTVYRSRFSVYGFDDLNGLNDLNGFYDFNGLPFTVYCLPDALRLALCAMRVAQDQLFWARILYLAIDNCLASIIFSAIRGVLPRQMIWRSVTPHIA